MKIDKVKVDDIDLRIVDLLKKNGRVQNNEIASQLNISEGTVRNRIKKLIDSNFLTIRGLINPCLIRDKMIIFLGIQLSDANRLEKAAEEITAFKEVISVYMVTGRYDLMVELFIEPPELLTFLSEELAAVQSITSTESFVTLKPYKKWL